MAVPKQKSSRSHTKQKRAKGYRAITVPNSKCSNCGEPKLPHRVCMACGFYNGKQVLEFGEEAKSEEKK